MHASTHKRRPGVISSPGTISTEGLTAKSFLTVVENSAAEMKEIVFISDNPGHKHYAQESKQLQDTDSVHRTVSNGQCAMIKTQKIVEK